MCLRPTNRRLAPNQLALNPSADDLWLVFAAPQSRSIEATGIWVVEQQSKSHLILDPATGAEPARHIREGNPELPALFDAIAASVQRSDATDNGS